MNRASPAPFVIATSFAKILRWLALPYYSYCQRLAALSFGKVEPLYFGGLKYGCLGPRVFRASPNTPPRNPCRRARKHKTL